MSTRNDYTVEEWELIRRAPAESVIAVEQASPSGLLGRRRERKAAVRSFTETIERTTGLELIDAIVAAREEEGPLLDALRASGESFVESALETARGARRALEARATLPELEAYVNAILTACEEVALAAGETKEAGKTSRAEALLLTRLATALGRTGYEPPDVGWIGTGGVQDMVADSNALGGIREIPRSRERLATLAAPAHRDPMASDDTSARMLADRISDASLGLFDVATIYLGERLGFYRALDAAGPLTAGELAASTGTRERFVREWCEQQAASGILVCPDPGDEPGERRFELPPGHAEVLARRDDPAYAAGGVLGLVAAVATVPDLPNAMRVAGPAEPDGAGSATAESDAAEGLGEGNRPLFQHLLAGWLASLPTVDARLRASPPARVLDVGCGAGWSSIAIATAYPLAQVDGVDADEASIAVARRSAEAEGLAGRVRFRVADGADPGVEGPFDLVTLFETVHDMTHPGAVLGACRRSLAPDGTCLVVDARVADRFTAPAGRIDRIAYGWSVVDCLPAVLGAEGTAATGAVMRPATLAAYARAAGFAGLEILPIEDPGWRFYRLVP